MKWSKELCLLNFCHHLLHKCFMLLRPSFFLGFFRKAIDFHVPGYGREGMGLFSCYWTLLLRFSRSQPLRPVQILFVTYMVEFEPTWGFKSLRK